MFIGWYKIFIENVIPTAIEVKIIVIAMVVFAISTCLLASYVLRLRRRLKEFKNVSNECVNAKNSNGDDGL